MATATDQQFCLRWNNFQSNITSAFENLRDEDDFVDVSLACEGRHVKAHKMVLSACSPYFRSLLKKNPCSHPIIILKDVKYSNLAALIDFMYHGEVNVAHDQLGNFLKTAESLKIRGLAEDEKQKSRASPVQSPPSQVTTEPEIVPSPPSVKRRRVQRESERERERPVHPHNNSESLPTASRSEPVEHFIPERRPPDPPVIPYVELKQEPQDSVPLTPSVIKESPSVPDLSQSQSGQNHQPSHFPSYLTDTPISAPYDLPLGLQSFVGDSRRTEYDNSASEKMPQAKLENSNQSGTHKDEKQDDDSFPSEHSMVPGDQSEVIQDILSRPGPSDTGPDMSQVWRAVPKQATPKSTCPHCHRMFHPVALKRHIKDQHTWPSGAYVCVDCQRWCRTYSALLMHRLRAHGSSAGTSALWGLTSQPSQASSNSSSAAGPNN